MTPPIFLSYASVDRERALAVADALDAAGIPVWIDRRGIPGGSVWIEEISRAVRQCPVLIVLCSAASVVSRNVRQEIQLAWDQDKPILPLLLEPVEFPDGVAYVLHGRQWIEIADRPESEWVADVSSALANVDSADSRLEPATTSPSSPSSSPSRYSNLPAPPTRLIGRATELDEIAGLLETNRLVTLTGPGGSGKTRLALEVAAATTHLAPDGVVFVDLSVVTNPEQVIAKIAETAGVRESPDRTLRAGLAAFFAGRQMLLLLDNLEHLLPAAPEIANLLADSPELRILVASRAALRVRAEREFVVDPLETRPALDLFMELARSAKPGLQTTPESLDAAAEICRRLDGLPLAIELAASRVRHLSVELLLARLQDRLPLLTGGARDLPERQQTLRNTIAWSYDLLSESDQRLFRRLSLFVGGCSLEAAEAVCGTSDGEVFDGLMSLVDHSMLQQESRFEHEPRFIMFETIREFGLNELRASGEEQSIRNRHAEWYSTHLEALWQAAGIAKPELLMKPLLLEQDNYRLALEFLERTGLYERLLRLASGTLWSYWFFKGDFVEGRGILERAMDAAPNSSPGDLAQAHFALGYLLWGQGHYALALAQAKRSTELFTHVGQRSGIAMSLVLHGATYEQLREPELAEASFLEALRLATEISDSFILGFAMSQLGSLALATGDFASSIHWSKLASAAFEQTGANWQVGLCLLNLGEAEHGLGQIGAAARHHLHCLRLWVDLSTPSYQCYPLDGIARVAAEIGLSVSAANLFGAEERLREIAGVKIWTYQQDWHDHAVNLARNALGAERFEAEWMSGSNLTFDAISALAQEVVEAAQSTSKT